MSLGWEVVYLILLSSEYLSNLLIKSEILNSLPLSKNEYAFTFWPKRVISFAPFLTSSFVSFIISFTPSTSQTNLTASIRISWLSTSPVNKILPSKTLVFIFTKRLFSAFRNLAAILTLIVASSITVPRDLYPSATTIALPPPVASTLAGEHP